MGERESREDAELKDQGVLILPRGSREEAFRAYVARFGWTALVFGILCCKLVD